MIRKIPKYITIVLNETNTIFLLDLPSSIIPRETDEGEAAEMDNRLYEYLTTGKGRNRKVASIGIQTRPVLMKTRNTEPVQYKFNKSSTFASNWVMYDTYNEDVVEDIFDESSDEETDEINDHKLIEEISLEELRKTKEIKEVEKLGRNKSYFDSVLVIERLLANNCYNNQQKKFKGLLEEVEEVRYDYKLDLLWTFANEDTKNRCVTGIAFNCFTEDIIAVAYGKYYFIDRRKTGVVMIWNIKNPKQPEREYYFKHPVTSLAFSTKNPNYLSVGFYNGELIVIDINKREFEMIGEANVSFKPVWSMLWLEQNQKEFLLVCFGDGRICKFLLTKSKLQCVEIMRTAKVEGKLKGLEALRLFEGNQISSSRHAAAVCLTLNKADPSTYFVGTDEGVIHKCAASYCTQHMDMFKAHEGTVHTIKFSPFVDKVFATCGNDFQKCLWIDGNIY